MSVGAIAVIFIFFFWSLIGFFILGFSARIGYCIEIERLNIVYIYKDRRVNWFGTFMLALVFNLICPAASIGYWFVKLCTIGRKYDDVSDN